MSAKKENGEGSIVTGKHVGSHRGSIARRALTSFLMWLFISLGFVLGGLVSIQVILYIVGDINFINHLVYDKDIAKQYHKFAFVSLFIGALAGAAVGGLLWYRFVRKTCLITDNELNRML